MGTLADRAEVERIHAQALEGLDNGLGALLGERVVDLVGAGIVGVSLDLETGGRVLLHIVGHLLDFLHRLGLQRGLAGLKQNIVGHELTRLDNGFFDGRRIVGSIAIIEFHSPLRHHYVSDIDTLFAI